MTHAQVRNDNVKFATTKGKLLRIRLDKGRVWHSSPRKRQHGRRKINTNHFASAANQCFGDVALSATEVERFQAGFGTDRIQETFDRLVRSGSKQFNISRSSCGIGPARTFQVSKLREVAHRQ